MKIQDKILEFTGYLQDKLSTTDNWMCCHCIKMVTQCCQNTSSSCCTVEFLDLSTQGVPPFWKEGTFTSKASKKCFDKLKTVTHAQSYDIKNDIL